jgi:hypothetical protein
MRACHIRPAMPGDTWLLLPTVRQPDIDELAALGVTPEMCIRHGLQISSEVFTIFLHGKPAGIFGAAPHPGLHVIPWAVFTTAIDEHPLPFLRASKRYIDSLTDYLENWVDARNTLTIKWLAWLGFTIEEPLPVGLRGELFHRFWRCATPHSYH